jgi:predicted metal-dependent phosphoesterase TrpH
MRIDLHTHSAVSDGTDPPHLLMVAAARAGLDVLALADHDTTQGWDEASVAAQRVGVRLVPAVEVSTSWQGADVHLLALWPDESDPALQAMLAAIRRARVERLPRILQRLGEHGIVLTEADVARAAGSAVSLGRPHVADALVAAGVVGSRREAFDVWLAEGRPGHVSKEAPSLPDAMAVVLRAGGVPVLAHPWGRSSRTALPPPALQQLAGLGLIGLEVDHVDHDEATRSALRSLAGDLGLVVTGSSDYHGQGKAGVELGVNVTEPDAFAALEQARGRSREPPGEQRPDVRTGHARSRDGPAG